MCLTSPSSALPVPRPPRSFRTFGTIPEPEPSLPSPFGDFTKPTPVEPVSVATPTDYCVGTVVPLLRLRCKVETRSETRNDLALTVVTFPTTGRLTLYDSCVVTGTGATCLHEKRPVNLLESSLGTLSTLGPDRVNPKTLDPKLRGVFCCLSSSTLLYLVNYS